MSSGASASEVGGLLSRVRKAAFYRRILLSEYLVVYLCVLYFAAFAVALPGFATALNLQNVFAAALPILVMAVGMTFVLISGGIDLSITATVAMCSVLGAQVMTSNGGPLAGSPLATLAGVIVMLLVGAAIGAFNGFATAFLRMPPFIVTLAVLLFAGGAAVWITDSNLIIGLPASFTAITSGSFLVFTYDAYIVGAIVIAAHFLLSRTLYGRWLYAIGTNGKAARISGVPVERYVVWTYVFSGLCAAVASIIVTGRLISGSPTILSESVLLDVIGAAVIGGASIYGGKGKVVWTVFGVLLLTMIDNSLNILGLSYFVITIVKGAVILLAALLDALRARFLAAERA
jgi:ribose/xylose/arabinose/galactoside ABC-type transport system permease subunit